MSAIYRDRGLVRPLDAEIGEAAALLYIAVKPALAADGEGPVALALIPKWDNWHLSCIQLGRKIESLRMNSRHDMLHPMIAAHDIDALEHPTARGCRFLAVGHGLVASPAVVHVQHDDHNCHFPSGTNSRSSGL